LICYIVVYSECLTFFEDFVEESNSFRLIRNPVEAREGGDQGERGGGVVGAEFLNKLKGQCYEILKILLK
jgi:hypothetical protein